MLAPLGEVVREARALLERELADLARAAFLYGSVVAGTARPGSDIDCFVVTSRSLRLVERRRIHRRFSLLQRQLGYTPDPVYPVELVTETECRQALEGPTLARCLAQIAATGRLDPASGASDEVEVWRALLGPRVALVPSECLDALTEMARRPLDGAAATAADVRAALGVDREPSRQSPVAQP